MKLRAPHVLLVVGVVGLALAAGALAAKPKVGPPPPKLYASVGPARQLALEDAKGKSVARLKSGWYTLQIKDSNAGQRFRLTGPGVNKATGVDFVGAAIWGVRLRKGTYSYASVGRASLAAGRIIERQSDRRRQAYDAFPKAWKRLRGAGDRAW
jgi:hypothetical protein